MVEVYDPKRRLRRSKNNNTKNSGYKAYQQKSNDSFNDALLFSEESSKRRPAIMVKRNWVDISSESCGNTTSDGRGNFNNDRISLVANTLRCFQHAVAIDVRLSGWESYEVNVKQNEKYLRCVREFISLCFRRGLHPSAISWIEPNHNIDEIRDGGDTDSMCIYSGSGDNDDEQSSSYRTRSISLTESNMEIAIDRIAMKASEVQMLPSFSKNNEEGIHDSRFITIRFTKDHTAMRTWQLFGNLVQQIIDGNHEALHQGTTYSSIENSGVTEPSYRNKPLKIVIVTKDTTSFLDWNIQAHHRGIDSFLKKFRKYFTDGVVDSIRIAVAINNETIVVRTGTVLKMHCDNKCDEEDENLRSDYVDISTIINSLKHYIQKKIAEDFEANRSRIHFDLKYDADDQVDVSVSATSEAVGLNCVYQTWSRELIDANVGTFDGRSVTNITSFRLPETSDFDGAELSFCTYYKTTPFRLDSVHTMELYTDLRLLSMASLKAVQLVPIDSVDSSLIYGVAISLKAAFRQKKDEYKEQALLVLSFLTKLSSKDCGLLLHSTGPVIDDKVQNGLFHSSLNQYFLLVPESGHLTSSAVLHRITCTDHILDLSQDINALTKSEEACSYLNEYIEASLEFLDCSPFNPYVRAFNDEQSLTFSSDPKKGKNKEDNELRKSPPKEKMVDETNRWNDDTGIGATTKSIYSSSEDDFNNKSIMNKKEIQENQISRGRVNPSQLKKTDPHRDSCDFSGSGTNFASSDDSIYGSFDYSS